MNSAIYYDRQAITISTREHFAAIENCSLDFKTSFVYHFITYLHILPMRIVSKNNLRLLACSLNRVVHYERTVIRE